jgi:hypothetical protein
MAPRRRVERGRLPTLLAALLGLLCFAVSQAGAALPADGPLELRGRWLIGEGAFHRGGRLCLRALDAERVALQLSLPPLPLLAEHQYFLREGEDLLTWAEPAGARELLAEEGPWRRRLAALPAAAWTALLGADGRGLAALLGGGAATRVGGWTVHQGSLGGHPARLRLRSARAWALDWELPEGTLHCHWPEAVAGGPQLLRVELPGGAWFRIAVRGGPRPALTPEAWLFLEAGGNRSARHAF